MLGLMRYFVLPLLMFIAVSCSRTARPRDNPDCSLDSVLACSHTSCSLTYLKACISPLPPGVSCEDVKSGLVNGSTIDELDPLHFVCAYWKARFDAEVNRQATAVACARRTHSLDSYTPVTPYDDGGTDEEIARRQLAMGVAATC